MGSGSAYGARSGSDCGFTFVTIFFFMLVQLTIGVSYMFMDSFIKLYTGKADLNKNLNPLLKGVAYGLLLQTLFWTLIHANDLADAVSYFFNSLKFIPPWSICDPKMKKCKATKDIILQCKLAATSGNKQKQISLNLTSAHHYYESIFHTQERSALTTKFFLIAMVWIINFFFSSVSDLALIRLFKLMYILRTLTTIFSTIFILFALPEFISIALGDLMNVAAKVSVTETFLQVSYAYGIGVVGLYDFGTLSPYTCVDNAILIFTISYTFVSLLRSLVTRILYLNLRKCVDINIQKGENNTEDYHYLIFVLLPLAADQLKASKVFSLYLYSNMMLTLCGHIAAFTLTMSKMLHSEFKAIKNLYIVGIISFIGCGLSIPVALGVSYWGGFINGLNITMVYLGAIRVAIIMYMYGMKKFCTDIQFWLNFKPTKYWRACWMLMPIILIVSYVLALKLAELFQEAFNIRTIPAYAWFCLTLLVITIIQIKTIVQFIIDNNLSAAFRSSPKYGPPDADERKKRKKYEETVNLRICRHACILLDDKFDCNHMPLMRKDVAEADAEDLSITSIFEAGRAGKYRTSSIMQLPQPYN
ncbi:sodium-dependent nutrient amino acid transporter 1-like [Hyposmocoma kahamanoa]|uniref:sodium-dependent nutrient amino acid transporter 1-like n=1 Tax=Hyposmocoma kahamanoa TaxID=1477025 RepID=UPI000E6D6D15|nr:sodium-dependent nutrient amino acid transporter 1-like [Hyposmocoma kahamanoa]